MIIELTTPKKKKKVFLHLYFSSVFYGHSPKCICTVSICQTPGRCIQIKWKRKMLHLNKGNLETFFFLLKLFHSPLFFFFLFVSSLSCDHQASRGAVTTLQVVTRSLVSLPTECCPRLHHSQKLRFNLPPSGFITGTPSGEPQEQLPAPSGQEISTADTKLIQSFLPALPRL